MNQRNVEALTALYVEWIGLSKLLPNFLASRGVLVPSALTVEAQVALDAAVECFPGEDEKALSQTIRVLERIAKGEPNDRP